MIKLASNLPNLLFFSHFHTFQCSSIVSQTQLLNCTGISIKRNRSKSNSIHGLFYLYTLSTFLVNYTSRWKLSDLFSLSQTKLPEKHSLHSNRMYLYSLEQSSGGLKSRQVYAEKLPIHERKGNPWVHVFIAIMSSVTACECVCMTVTATATAVTESHKMMAILKLIDWQRHAPSVCSIPFWYWTPMLWAIDSCQKKIIRWPLSGDHITGSSLEHIKFTCFSEVDCWPISGFFMGSQAHIRLTCYKQGRVVWKPVNVNPGIQQKLAEM